MGSFLFRFTLVLLLFMLNVNIIIGFALVNSRFDKLESVVAHMILVPTRSQ